MCCEWNAFPGNCNCNHRLTLQTTRSLNRDRKCLGRYQTYAPPSRPVGRARRMPRQAHTDSTRPTAGRAIWDLLTHVIPRQLHAHLRRSLGIGLGACPSAHTDSPHDPKRRRTVWYVVSASLSAKLFLILGDPKPAPPGMIIHVNYEMVCMYGPEQSISSVRVGVASVT